MEIFSSAQHQLSLVGDNSLAHDLRVMAAAELHVNATYYAQYPALKSAYGKKEPVIGGNPANIRLDEDILKTS